MSHDDTKNMIHEKKKGKKFVVAVEWNKTIIWVQNGIGISRYILYGI